MEFHDPENTTCHGEAALLAASLTQLTGVPGLHFVA
jgi:hypothetical protein